MNKPDESRNRFLTLLSVPGIYTFLLYNLLRQKRFVSRHIARELTPVINSNDGSLLPADLKKITNYYALGVPGILGASLGVLRGASLTFSERSCLTYLGGISGLLDDLFDDPSKEVAHLKQFILEPEQLHPKNSHEGLLLEFYRKGLALSANPTLLKEQALKVYEAQEKSLQQHQPDGSPGVIDEIIYQKGGASFVFYRFCMDHPMNKAEENLLFHLGGLMQLGNDIFDVWEDHKDNIHTAATRCRDIRELRINFTKALNLTSELAYKTAYPSKQVKKFLLIISLSLARVYVCLDQFEKLQTATGNEFKLEKYSRKQLICDMQKPGNQIKAIKYYIGF